jgi:hypothetical protein
MNNDINVKKLIVFRARICKSFEEPRNRFPAWHLVLDPYLWLMDQDPDPDPTPDPTSVFIEFKDAIKIIFLHFFLLLANKNIIFSLKNLIFCSNFVLKFYFVGIISARSTHLWEKGRIRSQIRIRSRIRIHTSDKWIRIREAKNLRILPHCHIGWRNRFLESLNVYKFGLRAGYRFVGRIRIRFCWEVKSKKKRLILPSNRQWTMETIRRKTIRWT